MKSKRITMWAVSYKNDPTLPWIIVSNRAEAEAKANANVGQGRCVVFKVYFDYVNPEPITLRAKA